MRICADEHENRRTNTTDRGNLITNGYLQRRATETRANPFHKIKCIFLKMRMEITSEWCIGERLPKLLASGADVALAPA
jgi:hypothetical protein